VVTVVLAFLVFAETLGPAQIAGGVLVLAAVPALHARWPQARRRTRPEPAPASRTAG
jgi:drug/metabolite transporter (DMT)-like permease